MSTVNVIAGDFRIKQGDTADVFKLELIKDDGSKPVLTGATFKIYVGNKYCAKASQSVVVEEDGIITFQFGDGDVVGTGELDVEVKVIYADGTKETFPEQSYLKLKVIPNLEYRGTGFISQTAYELVLEDLRILEEELETRIEELKQEMNLSLDNKSDVGHLHKISDVELLQTKLDELRDEIEEKTGVTHKHNIADVIGLLEKLTELEELIEAKAKETHTHAISDVTGLTNALNGKADKNHVHTQYLTEHQNLDHKADVEHTHEIENVNGLIDELANKSDVTHTHTLDSLPEIKNAIDEKVGANHTHKIDQVEGLVNELGNKALKSHKHEIKDTNGLQTALDDKADKDHTHTELEGLQDKLDAKANAGHTHTLAEIPSLNKELKNLKNTKADITETREFMHITEDAIDDLKVNKSDVGHTHTSDEIVDLGEKLDGKADIYHEHFINEVIDLEETLNTKANTDHKHLFEDIDGLVEELDSKSNKGHSHTDLSTSISKVAIALETKAEIADVEHLESQLTELEEDIDNLQLSGVTGNYVVVTTSEIETMWNELKK